VKKERRTNSASPAKAVRGRFEASDEMQQMALNAARTQSYPRGVMVFKKKAPRRISSETLCGLLADYNASVAQ